MNTLLFLVGILYLRVYIGECELLLLCDSNSVKELEEDMGKDNVYRHHIVFKKPSPSISNIFSYAAIIISSDVPFQINEGNETSYFSSLVKRSKTQTVFVKEKLSCFEDYNVNLTSKQPSTIIVKIMDKTFDRISFVLFCVGCILFINAKVFSRSAAFMYASCASVGAFGSLLIILIIFYRLVPFKRTMAFFFTIGSGMWFYFLNHLQNVIGTLIQNYPYHVISYLAFSALVSISLLYYFGIPSNDKALNLLQWFMQLAAIYMIYFSCYNNTFPVTIVVILMLFQFVSFSRTVSYVSWLVLPRKFVLWLYPPPQRRLLTLEEYEQQGREATQKALKDLQLFCTSSKCNSWEVVSKLKDPKRFANFLSNGDQFTNEEVDDYFVEDEHNDSAAELDQQTSIQNDLSKHLTRTMDERELTEWISDDERGNSTLLTD